MLAPSSFQFTCDSCDMSVVTIEMPTDAPMVRTSE